MIKNRLNYSIEVITFGFRQGGLNLRKVLVKRDAKYDWSLESPVREIPWS